MSGDDLLFVASLMALFVAGAGLGLRVPASQSQMRFVTYGTLAVAALVLASFVWLTLAFAASDFSYVIVLKNSHTDKPLFYKIAAVWGNHEGSILLWTLIASLYGAALALFNRQANTPLMFRALGVQAALVFGFIAYLLLASDPFKRMPFAPPQGMGLNPLLQDPALSFHPPMLYLGYVGMSSVFSLALAALLTRSVSRAWATLAKKWVLFSWSALTLGIAMGSWWAYYELGWGGWWFWDPVENASLVPWLSATALLHALVVMEKRGSLKSWAFLLAIITFVFCLIGTFLVRSGIITSVHAFASDPARGIFILLLISLIGGWGLLLFALRAKDFMPETQFTPLSRESFMVLNTIFLFTGSLTVLIGTVYPLLLDLFAGQPLSVGPPYYENTFTPLMMPMVLLMGIAPFVKWERDEWRKLLPELRLAGLCVLAVIAIILFTFNSAALRFVVGFAFAAWLLATSARQIIIARKATAVALAHAGLGIMLIGVVASSHLSVDKIQLMNPGDTLTLNGYSFHFDGMERVKGPNYLADRGLFTVTQANEKIAQLTPERRLYPVAEKILSEVAISTNGLRDLYLVLGDAQKDAKGKYNGWSVQVRINPMIPWLWIGCAVMAAGGVLGLVQKKRDA